jgi:hypothetical protein
MTLDARILAAQAMAEADEEDEIDEDIEEAPNDAYMEPEQLLTLPAMPKKEHWSPARTPNVKITNDLHRRAWKSSLHGKKYF